MTALLIGFFLCLFLLVALLCIAYVAGDDLPRVPTPGRCWDCGFTHGDPTTIRCHHCAEVPA